MCRTSDPHVFRSFKASLRSAELLRTHLCLLLAGNIRGKTVVPATTSEVLSNSGSEWALKQARVDGVRAIWWGEGSTRPLHFAIRSAGPVALVSFSRLRAGDERATCQIHLVSIPGVDLQTKVEMLLRYSGRQDTKSGYG